jgi:hypothetical protein
MANKNPKVDVLIWVEPVWPDSDEPAVELQWVAQCVQHDLAAQGKSPQDAVSNLDHIIKGHLLIPDEVGSLEDIEPPMSPDWNFQQGLVVTPDPQPEHIREVRVV